MWSVKVKECKYLHLNFLSLLEKSVGVALTSAAGQPTN
jgi:hypothetical protein